MAQLAIKGHETRGKEVIEILEMLGGKTSYDCSYKDGFNSSYFFFIDKNFFIDGFAYNSEELKNCYILTLEEFLENFPYKVGDKVYNIIHNEKQTITNLIWDSQENEVVYKTNNNEYVYVNYLQPYKEKTMEIKPNLLQQLKEYFDNTPREVLEKEWNELSYLNEIGPTVDEYLECVKKYRQSNKYPKTYEECCEVLFPSSIELGKVLTSGYGCEKLKKFGELLICRDAYWKLAGEQMGLGKPWEPDWTNNYQKKWIINFYQGEINLTSGPNVHFVLAFPSEEMRDIFYENFKDLIESCKEFL